MGVHLDEDRRVSGLRGMVFSFMLTAAWGSGPKPTCA